MNVILGSQGEEINYAGRKFTLDGALLRNVGTITTTEQLVKRFDSLKVLRNVGTVTINSPESIMLARDKFASLLELAKNHVPIPETAMVEDPREAMTLTERWGEVVIKPLIGSLGLGSVKVSDPDIAYRVSKSILSVNQPVYVQKYVKKPDRDIRVFVVGDEVIGSIFRFSNGSWKTNVAQGAVAQMLTISSEIKEIGLKVVKAMKMDYAGIDVVEDTEDNSYKVLEVNASPLWHGFKTATGINPAKFIVKHLLEMIKK
ncbi:Tetrahydromethanopterin:alpha-L-glutamate ligase [Sulfuracidifex tepidarius]|uniref:Tetrahydromethanopterin:alpha-L-glutamate ligase n=1 Tax=Sulfuracidifex tepidarius TaxID=1294262 RepID=A0A510E7D1_9CREN|nr:Tetrahydromethanopterin:alpha-L-glutamate ligase [Sulfuracidifex tepidarius]BBG28188.1 Tetrahydromethanopterin:alpha-L-glutamate ligase [Sulfuracidifex tepidarius]